MTNIEKQIRIERLKYWPKANCPKCGGLGRVSVLLAVGDRRTIPCECRVPGNREPQRRRA